MSRDRHRAAWGIAATAAMVAVLAGALRMWQRYHPDAVTFARRAYEHGEWQRAADALRGVMKSESGLTAHPEVLRLYARALVRLERDSAAKAIYEGRLASADLEPEDAFLKGLMMTRTGRPEAALALWDASLKERGDHPEMLDHYARLSARFQLMDPALDAARRLSRQPGWEARGLFLVGQIYDLIDDPPGAVEALEEALRRDPEARGAVLGADHYRKTLARNLLRLGRAPEAEKQLKAIHSESTQSSAKSEDREVDWLLSRAYLQQGRMAEASESLTRSGPYGADRRMRPEPSPYLGSAACAPCHRNESRSYNGTRHTRTFYHGAGLLGLPWPDGPVPDPDDSKVTHRIDRRGEKIEASSEIEGQVSRMVVEYAFGTPEHYLTMIARDEEKKYRALRVSYYHTPTDSGWGATAGDVGHSGSPEDRRGQRIDVRDGVVRCLYCHVTRSRDFRDPPPAGGPGPTAADRAIGCERCHGPGGNHIRAIEKDLKDLEGSSDFAIVNAAGAPGTTANGMCAECHTVGLPADIERAPDDPRYVRSPGVTFKFSRCFTESRGTMSCMTCHDPHREADHSASFYEAKCLACHSGSATSSKAAPVVNSDSSQDFRRTVCPVSPAKGCLDCHMPKVPMPTLHKGLTDHYIRVHRPSEKRASGLTPRASPSRPSGATSG
jgi:tetratricopeptide (TPR) repeat protein